MDKKNIILPVWAGVDQKAVYEYSPSLANIVSLNWDIGPEEISKKIIDVFNIDYNNELGEGTKLKV